MVWSNWRGALVVLAAWVGLAWTQAFTQSGSSSKVPTKSERIMTLYENGKAIRCRVIGSWKEADGTAYQLQSLESGELITIVEAGQAASTQANGRKTVRTRNFHWGLLNRTPPRGCPTPPEHIMNAFEGGSSGPVIASGPPIIMPDGSTVVSQTPTRPDEKLWWEEKNGQRVSPIITTKGENPFEEKSVVTAGAPPVIIQEGPVVTLPPGTSIHTATPGIGIPGVPETTTLPSISPVAKTTPTITEIELPTPVTRCYPCVPGTQRLGDRIRDFFGAKNVPTVARRDLPTRTPSVIPERIPFSTAADTTKPKLEKPEAKPLVMGEKNDTVTPAKGIGEDTAKKDWRTMWGQGSDTTVQQPGQSLMQAAVKPGKGPWGTAATSPDSTKTDILLNPERVDAKNPTKVEAAGGVPTGSYPGTGVSGAGGIPLGSSSVIAATSGLQGRVTYVPVPVATVPEPTHPPMPPAPRIPEPPQPTAYLNAFTPPPAPTQMASAPMGYPGMMPHPGMLPASYPGMAGPVPMHPSMAHPGMNPGMMHPGMANPGMVHPAMMQKPMMPMGYPQQTGTPSNPFNVARSYSGPMPPNPFGGAPTQPIMQASYTPTPAPMPTATPPAQVTQLLQTLRESMYPAQREWAANQLCNFDWRAQPEVLPALLTAARHDPAATVRAGCVYSLSRMNAATQPVMETLHALRGDTDPRVRQEVENALVRMGMGR